MSDFKVEVLKVEDVFKHPNADRLDIISVKGWRCVVSKDTIKIGDKIVYIPIDSIVPIEVETAIFGIDSKVKLSKSRVRTIKLRGAISQGLAVLPEVVGLDSNSLKIGADLTSKLKIIKFEPEQKGASITRGKRANKREQNPNFHRYGGISNFKNYVGIFENGEEVVITEKIHGTHFRCGWVKYYAATWWDKLKDWFVKTPEWQFVFGSNNVQLQNKLLYDGYYDSNVYAKIVKQYNLKDKIPKGVVIHGEIYGSGIQKNYNYGMGDGEHGLVVFDVKDFQCYWPQEDSRKLCKRIDLPFVPIIHIGEYCEEDIDKLVKGASILCPDQKVREGIVIQSKTTADQRCILTRKILKRVSEDYLLDPSNTDFH